MSALPESGRVCPTCSTVAHGGYCANCGERQPNPGDFAFRAYARQWTSALIDSDGRIVKTLKALVARPGYLTQAFMAGRRKPYLTPAGIFVALNVLYFVTQSVVNVNSFDAGLDAQTTSFPHSEWASALVDETRSNTGETKDSFRARYDDSSTEWAKVLVFLQIPVLALAFAGMMYRQRRFFVEHLTFATHFYALLLLCNVCIAVGVFVYWQFGGNDFDLQYPLLAVMYVYLTVASRRVWSTSWPAAALIGAGGTIASIVALDVFRFLLFSITWATMASP